MPDLQSWSSHWIPANLTGFGVGTLKASISEYLSSFEVRDIVVPVQGLFAQKLPQYKSEMGSIAFLHADRLVSRQ